MSEPVTVEELREERIKEYAAYVATQTIFIGGARAFNVGDPVPISHVERGVVNADEVKSVDEARAEAADEAKKVQVPTKTAGPAPATGTAPEPKG